MSKIIKLAGLVLFLVGFGAMGFFDWAPFGQIEFSFLSPLTDALGQTLAWWSQKILGSAIGIIGTLLMKMG